MRKFLFIWIGELISSIGSGMTAFALSVYVYQMTKSVSYVSLITLLAYMPTILLSPLGGILADRYDRRLLMIIGDFCSGLGVVLIFWQIQAGNRGILPIFIGVTISAVFVALMEPAYRATVTDLLKEEEYDKASGMVQLAGNARYLVSPALAGLLLAAADIRLILLIDIGTFFLTVSAVAIVRRTIKKPVKKAGKGIREEMKEGLEVITQKKQVLSVVLLMTCICFFIGFVQTLAGPMILAVSNARTCGIMESLCAVGMVVGSIWIGVAGIRGEHRKVLRLAGILCGFFMAVAGINKNLLLTGIGIFLFFLCLPFMNTCGDVLVRVSIPNEMQGRVWGMISLLTQAGTVAAYISCGVLADYIFEPMFVENGLLFLSIGRIIGTGEGRGIGFMLILAGLGMAAVTLLVCRSKGFQATDTEEK